MSKEDDCTVQAEIDGNGHNWEYFTDTGLRCVYCETTESVENVEGFSKEDAPDWPDSKPIGLEKYT